MYIHSYTRAPDNEKIIMATSLKNNALSRLTQNQPWIKVNPIQCWSCPGVLFLIDVTQICAYIRKRRRLRFQSTLVESCRSTRFRFHRFAFLPLCSMDRLSLCCPCSSPTSSTRLPDSVWSMSLSSMVSFSVRPCWEWLRIRCSGRG